MSEVRTPTSPAWVLGQGLALLGLYLLVLGADFPEMMRTAWIDLESVHFLVVPVLIGLLLYRRRTDLARVMGRGSWAGLLVLALAIGAVAVARWPFNHASVRWFSIVPAVAGILLLVGGWRVFWRTLPVVVLLALAVPVGARLYAFLIVRIETSTLETAAALLGVLPNVLLAAEGQDLLFYIGERHGAVALGEMHRGASLLLAYLSLGVFVVFARTRPMWQVVTMAVLAAPIVLLCNLVRLLVWGLLSIYAGVDVVSPVSRLFSTTVAMALAFACFAGVLALLDRVLVTDAAPAAPVGADP